MTTSIEKHSTLTAPTQFVESNGRRLAYRSFGAGTPIVLCNRFRGILDTWDPAFLDALARNFTVVIFDFSGLGLSTGTATFDARSLATDARDLVVALGYEKVVIGGWSLGGTAAQAFTALFPELTSHAILIGTVPPGPNVKPAEQLFFDTALRYDNSLEDEAILFFEPRSERSVQAAKESHARIAQRTTDLSVKIPEALYTRLLIENRGEHLFNDRHGYRDTLAATAIPMLAINGDHDIIFPVENWYALNQQWRSLHIVTFPRAGHGPQHEFPETVASYITTFVATIA